MRSPLGTRTRVALAAAAATTLALLAPGNAGAAGGVPNTPTDLYNGLLACSTDASAPVYVAGRGGLELEGIASHTDPTANHLSEEFRYWPTADPAQLGTAVRDWAYPGSEASVEVTGLTDGATYGWQARTVGPDGAASDWSAACYVAVDDTTPAAAPTVSSPNYPQGQTNQPGAPIQIDLGANGVGDVAGYQITWYSTFSVPGASIGEHGIPHFLDPFDGTHGVRAQTVGGTARMTLVPPAGLSGWLTLDVRSMDRAYNASQPTRYTILLKPDAPTVTRLSHATQFGKPTPFRLSPEPGLQAASPVVSYTVTHYGTTVTTTTVPANPNGTAETTVTLDGPSGDKLVVNTTSANGWTSQQTWWDNGYLDSTPTITSPQYPDGGENTGPGTFHFAPKIKGAQIASYTYSFDWGNNPITIPAAAHGEADVIWTPPTSGWYLLIVHATTKDGVALDDTYYSFTVD
ncbi:hypothetical protein AB0K51_05975 [Kitasatospora sp. NPDC049285]|uniref:hypothetical protein n=1 Tax=Kitasatospora sp. NPDC049285 TaxID=3157096 RepID=UPI00341F0C4C